jgi:hypothetical protein
MTINATACSREMSHVWSVPEDDPSRLVNWSDRHRGISFARAAVYRTVRWSIFALIGWLSFVSAANSAWRAASLAVVLALATLVGITWYLSRVRADRRWRIALDAYAEKEQAQRTYSRRNFHGRPQSRAR